MVVVLVVAASLATVPNGSTAAPAVYGTPFDYYAFESAVASADLAAPDGPWTPLAISGIGSDQSEEGTSTSSSVGASGCGALWGATGTFVLPATPSDAPAGEVSLWTLFSINGAGDLLLSFANDFGAGVRGYALEVLPPGCLSGASEFGSGIVNETLVDSPTIVANASAAGGSAFLSVHSPVTTFLDLFDDYWGVEYSTCSLSATGGSGVAFLSGMWATNGTLIPHSTGTEAISPC